MHRPQFADRGEEREGVVAVVGSPRSQGSTSSRPLIGGSLGRSQSGGSEACHRSTRRIHVDEAVADWYERQRDAWGYLRTTRPAFATRPESPKPGTPSQRGQRPHGAATLRARQIAPLAPSARRTARTPTPIPSRHLRRRAGRCAPSRRPQRRRTSTRRRDRDGLRRPRGRSTRRRSARPTCRTS